LDCSGLVYVSFKEGFGITIPRTSEGIYSWTERIETKELQPGDLVFFVTTGSSISHVGIYTGDGRFIHAASEGPQTGVIYSRLDESYWNRTYRGAGRAFPWDEEAAAAMANSRPGVTYPERGGSSVELNWEDSGFYTGFGAAWAWGGVFEGAISPLRGISTIATAGYKWSRYRAALQLRPEWDRAMGVFRLPITASFGTDIIQGFAGPSYTFGVPSLNLDDRDRYYSGGWLWEIGVTASIPPIQIYNGVLSFYGELAWQPYRLDSGEDSNFKHDFTAGFKASTGLRYLWNFQ